MQAFASNNLTVEKEELATSSLPDFASESYKDAYSRINAVVIEGEQEAYANFLDLAKLIPEHAEELVRLGKMEKKHMNGFCACGRNLAVKPDMPFAKTFFSKLHNNFIDAFKAGDTTTCLLIQCILNESFAISAYHVYIRVADPFAKRITEGVVQDEYLHLNYGQEWLKANLEKVKKDLMKANKENLPLIKSMLDEVSNDAEVLHMDKEELMEEFMIAYQDSLMEIGLDNREIARMALAAVI